MYNFTTLYILELIELLKKNLDIIYIECYENIIKI